MQNEKLMNVRMSKRKEKVSKKRSNHEWLKE